VVFILGPRINAAGRLKHAKAAVQLLLSQDIEEALDFATEIHKHNQDRRTLDANISKEAIDMILQDDFLLKQASSTVVYSPNWHKGVIGIVASRLIENFHRPTVVFSRSSESHAAGSARSVPGFDLYAALEKCSHILEQFGGHMHAAGMTIPLSRIEEFKHYFDEIVKQQILPSQLIPQINVDLDLPLSEISPKFYSVMMQMSPFGPQNMLPVFVSKNLVLPEPPRILKDLHLKITAADPESGVAFEAIGFNIRDKFYDALCSTDKFHMAYTVDINTFNGKSNFQLMIKDLKF
jgi:single-stranded-DNA-specific exonuclease